ncbi:SH3 domain-containing protein [Streptomyces sp. HU2014]|uniref:SH3 domain-containing protein n=1 Tax=Streptomyces sp. HU2014 TaxID=2939414 RepID=UPI00200F07CE|nr:SH3 domain-containing protein [Streptomyces sp. HU2014]UQI47719.1 SH3 domain-containing protein [Streptomyces sp. HU2014]
MPFKVYAAAAGRAEVPAGDFLAAAAKARSARTAGVGLAFAALGVAALGVAALGVAALGVAARRLRRLHPLHLVLLGGGFTAGLALIVAGRRRRAGSRDRGVTTSPQDLHAPPPMVIAAATPRSCPEHRLTEPPEDASVRRISLVSLTLTTAALIGGTAVIAAPAQAAAKVCNADNAMIYTDGTRLRAKAGSSGAVKGQLYFKDPIRITGKSGGWDRVVLKAKSRGGLPKGTTGWVAHSHIIPPYCGGL